MPEVNALLCCRPSTGITSAMDGWGSSTKALQGKPLRLGKPAHALGNHKALSSINMSLSSAEIMASLHAAAPSVLTRPLVVQPPGISAGTARQREARTCLPLIFLLLSPAHAQAA